MNCVSHFAASKTMWLCFCYEPSATCGSLIGLNMPTFLASRRLMSFQMSFSISFSSSFFLLGTVHLFLTMLVAQRREIRGLATNLTLQNSIFHKEVFEASSVTRQGSFPFKKTF